MPISRNVYTKNLFSIHYETEHKRVCTDSKNRKIRKNMPKEQKMQICVDWYRESESNFGNNRKSTHNVCSSSYFFFFLFFFFCCIGCGWARMNAISTNRHENDNEKSLKKGEKKKCLTLASQMPKTSFGFKIKNMYKMV